VDQVLVLGISVAFLGVIMFVTSRLRFFRSFMAIRRQLIEQATISGDTDRAAALSRDLEAWENRFPKYALWLICAGLIIAFACAALLFHGTRTI
jgi:hypothetical protein